MKNMFQQINQLDRQIGGIYHEAALKMGFSDSELWILYALSVSAAGCRQTELCQSTGMTKTTVNSALKKMEEAGVLYRAPGSGRNTLVFLTEQGAALAERTVCRLIKAENEIYEGWTPEEQSVFLRLNRDFMEKLDAWAKPL